MAKRMTKRTVPKQSRCCRFACGILAIFLLTPSPLQAGAMTDQIRTAVEKVVAILRDPYLNPDARKNERQTKLRQAIDYVCGGRCSIALKDDDEQDQQC